MQSVSDYTRSSFIRELSSSDKFDALEELASVFKGSDVCSDVSVLINALKEREEIMSTGIGFGIAIPHAKISEIKNISFAVGVSKKGIDFDSMDGNPVHLIILVAAGESQHKDYLALLSCIMSLLKDEKIKDGIISAGSSEEILELLKK